MQVIATYGKSRAAVSEVLVVVRQFLKPLRGETSDTVFVVPEKKLPFMNENCLRVVHQQQVLHSEQAFLPDRHTHIQQASISEELLYI